MPSTWRTVSPFTSPSTDDINQMLSMHQFVATFPGAVAVVDGTPYADSNFLTDTLQLCPQKNGITGYSQSFTLSSTTTLSAVKIPMFYTQQTDPSSAYLSMQTNTDGSISLGTSTVLNQSVNFSSAIDVTVSIQTAASVGTPTPTGTVVSTNAQIEVPAAVTNGVANTSWNGHRSMLPGQLLPATTPSFPIAFASTTITQSVSLATLTSGSSFTLYVASTTGFPSTFGTLVVWNGAAYAQISYTGTTATSFTGCVCGTSSTNMTSGTAILQGYVAQVAPALTFAYIACGDWLLAANLFSTTATSVTNTTYVAPYLGNGVLGSWQQGTVLPETNCSITYAPSSSTLFAIGPSGALYQASFDTATGTVGSWLVIKPSGYVSIQYTSYAAPVVTVYTPALCVATIDNVDYLFIMGGFSSYTPLYTAYYAPIDSSGNVGTFTQSASLPWGVTNTSAGVPAFYDNGYLYVIDYNTNAGIQVITLPVWVDITGNFNVGTWSYLAHDFSATKLVGYASNTLITDYGVTNLANNGYGSSDYTFQLPQLIGPNGIGFSPAIYYGAATFVNDDDSVTVIYSSGFTLTLYPTDWVKIPINATLSAGTYCLVITASSSTQTTNYGVNLRTVSAYSPGYLWQSKGVSLKNAYQWTTPSSQNFLPFMLWDNTGHLLGGVIEESGQKWSMIWYDYPNHILANVIEVTQDATQSTHTTSMLALGYDGLGSKNATQPMLTTITEVA